MRAAIYCRFSTDKQRDESTEDQERVCREYARREGWEITRVFADKGLSGSDATRPGYQAMLANARGRQFDILLCEDVSRLWRDEVEQPRCVEELQFLGTHVVGINDGIDTRREGFEYLLAIKGVQNAGFRKEIGKRTHRGQEGQALKGYNCGGRAYGYKHVPIFHPTERDRLTGARIVTAVRREPDPVQAKIIKEIFTRYVAGTAPRTIADDLNSRGIPSPGANWKRTERRKDGKWLGSAIAAMLDNPLYSGLYIWNRSKWIGIPRGTKKPNGEAYRAKKMRKERPESEWITHEDESLRIIDKKTWDAVQARRKERAAMADNQHPDIRPRQKYLFSGLLVCGECGQKFTVSDAYRYGCGSHVNGGKHACGNALKVPRRLVEEKLLKGIKEELFHPAAVEEFKREAARLLAEHKRSSKPDTAANKRQLAAVEKQIENMVAAIAAGAFSDALKAALATAEAERARLQAALNVDTRQIDKVAEFLPRALDRYRALVEDLENTTQREIGHARHQIKQLLGGTVRLVPSESGTYLEAEIAGDYAGLIKLASSGANLNMHGSGGRI